MTVEELITELKKLPGDTPVIQSSDEEGNRFSQVGAIELGRFDGEDYGLYELTEEFRDMGFTEEDVPEGPPVVCIWPE